jgi:hypothetical protein
MYPVVPASIRSTVIPYPNLYLMSLRATAKGRTVRKALVNVGRTFENVS